MDEEPFDILGYGTRPQTAGGAPPNSSSTKRDPPPAIRTLSISGPPPATAFSYNGKASSPASFNASGKAISINNNNNNKYSTTSSGTGGNYSGNISRTSSYGGDSSALDEEDDDDEEEEDHSIDNEIGREYDNHRIRQEALRMLEVAEAGNSKYSVHRTATGGFTAQPRSLGSQRGRTALTGLNFVARNNTIGGKRYADLAVASAEHHTGSARDDYEYGDESVVDRNGLEQRSAENEGHVKSSWSSRYAIDKTVLAMSGGAMRQQQQQNKRSHTDPERLSALNLFNSSPGKATQVFGSGFTFRQNHVYGKQNVSMDIRNLHGSDGPDLPSKTVKSWQEQLIQKNLQRRRLIVLVVCVSLLVFLVPASIVYGVRRLKRFPADGSNGSVSFGVTTNGPYEDSDLFVKQIEKSNEMTSFTVHLGNIQKVEVTNCTATAYENMSTRLINSSNDPIFIVPGPQDWIDCPDPEAALVIWKEHFVYFDRKWDATDGDDPEERDFLVFRQREQRENWAFLRDGVLFIGVHVVNGPSVVNGIVPTEEQFNIRNKYNYDWVSGLANAHKASIHAIVIFGNASPGQTVNANFFGPLEIFWKEFDIPALYMHAAQDVGKMSKAYHPFKDLKNFLATTVNPSDDASTPLMVNVGQGSAPFRLS